MAIKSDLPFGITAIGGTQSQHILLRKRGEFVQSYCQEKGWNPEALTVEQVLEIRNQPGWKNPQR
jgi:hypothetical protein